MPNPYNNEVVFNGQTLMSLKEDTVTPDKVLAGETFHDRSGAPQTGNLITHNVYDDLDSTSTSDALSANQGRKLNNKLTDKIQYFDIDIAGFHLSSSENNYNYYQYDLSSLKPANSILFSYALTDIWYSDIFYEIFSNSIIIKSTKYTILPTPSGGRSLGVRIFCYVP